MTSPTATPRVVPFVPAPSAPPLAPPPLPSVADLGIYYENGKRFLVANGPSFITMDETKVRRLLVAHGYPRSAPSAAGPSAIERAMHEVETSRVVEYAGPLAGWRAGLHVINGQRVLVTGGPTIILPDADVDWQFLRRLIEGILGHEPRQLTHFYGWLKVAYVGLRKGLESERGPDSPGQALAFAGPAECGKTLLQRIVQEILGGRTTDPFAYMTSKTSFNRDLFEAEFLSFGDQVSSRHPAARRAFGAMLKQLVANSEHRCEAKGQNALTLRPFWRISLSLNDEPENIRVLPPLDPSVRDKLMLFKACRPALFDSSDWSHERASNWERIRKELPGFLAFIESFTIPADLRNGRFGVREFHHPDLLIALDELSEERRLLDLIDEQLFTRIAANLPEPRRAWVGKSSQLERALVASSSAVSEAARRLLDWNGAAGSLLSRLCTQMPERFSKEAGDGSPTFTILPPASPAPTPKASETQSNTIGISEPRTSASQDRSVPTL